MTSPFTPSDSSSLQGSHPSPEDEGQGAGPLGFEETARVFWTQNRNAVFVLCGLVVLGIAGTGVWGYMARQKDLDAGREFAACATPEALKSFAESHAGHPLAAAADLKRADEAYEAGRMDEAAAAYEKASASLPDFLALRADLGEAMAEAQSGRVTEAEDILRRLSGEGVAYKTIRAQAAYQLASLAADAGRSEEVQRLSEELVHIDPQSPWTQRAFGLRARLAVEAPSAKPAGFSPTMAVPIQLGGSGASGAAPSSITLPATH